MPEIKMNPGDIPMITAYLIDHDHLAVMEVEVLRGIYDGVVFDVCVTGLPKRMRPFYMADETTGKTLSAIENILVFHDRFPTDDNAGGNPAMDEAKRRMALRAGMAAVEDASRRTS